MGPNYEYASTELVLSYDSLITPLESILIDMDDPENVDGRRVLKQKHVPGYDKSLYGCERTTVTARDGSTEIPVSLVYRRDVIEEHVASGRTVPAHLYGEMWRDGRISFANCYELVTYFILTYIP